MHACPKYVTDKTPEPYREWLLAIAGFQKTNLTFVRMFWSIFQ
jgi:hypothetical protein